MQKTGLLSLLSSPLIWRGGDVAVETATVPTGHAALDAVLPGGGWPANALTELLHEEDGLGELSLLMPTLARLAAEAPIAFVAPPYLPYAPALVQAGMALQHLVIAQPERDQDAWWAAEQLLRAGQFRAVLFWPDQFDERGLRRLQLACEQGVTPGFVFHDSRWAPHSSPAPLRIRIETPSHGDGSQLLIRVLKRRGSLVAQPVRLTRPAHLPIVPGKSTGDVADDTGNAVEGGTAYDASQASPTARRPGLRSVISIRQQLQRRARSNPLLRLAPGANTLSLSKPPER